MPQSDAVDPDATIAIVGGGQAGAEVATQLRQNRHQGRIVLFGDENVLPYMRPPLSKAYLAGEMGADGLIYKAAVAYEKANVELRLGESVVAIDRNAKKLALAGGESLAYDRLVIAAGGRARKLRVPGADLGNIFYLRSIADVEQLRPQLQSGRRLVIVGGGYVGLEFAAVAIKRGLKVLVLEAAPRVLARVTAPEVSNFYERFHRAAGVEIRTGVAVSGFSAREGSNDVGAVLCGEDPAIEADFVLVGIGLVPNMELAKGAGLAVDGGILVDEAGRTNDHEIFAIGDCAVHVRHGFLHRTVRLESVPNALEQARTVAAVLTGKPIPAATPPWFWSDQYDLKLQMVGLSEGYDELAIRGSTQSSSFIAFYLKDGYVIAADAINRPSEFMASKRLIGDRIKASARDLADEQVSLKALLAAAAA
ncbi:FAD-dependent pyridine nucleotide-disulphide oxidoreductase [Methylocella silvestris BL2]|uniref:FAD-dependent pyridine nucleotide-disulphide oxidoreductase n=1 Tax=Methylocella silvestris (strain DSM 15510 / CIP 108128 / LMG 27833 / NCIMB 13906 / BL2) TaxID=395965 RepID=B8EJM7_METSB|nr:FAD-dependent oxidoreductase [Methylocella silvestris]ACK49431.1 FAD-dependent pyridine nucleotide-disulphide oxidoreductase [Methylocella silvestris BL2]